MAAAVQPVARGFHVRKPPHSVENVQNCSPLPVVWEYLFTYSLWLTSNRLDQQGGSNEKDASVIRVRVDSHGERAGESRPAAQGEVYDSAAAPK